MNTKQHNILKLHNIFHLHTIKSSTSTLASNLQQTTISAQYMIRAEQATLEEQKKYK